MNWIHLKMPVIKNKLFLKILMYFLSLLIPILIIGSFVYYDMNKMIERDVSQRLLNNLASSTEIIELHLSMAQSTANNLLLSDIIQRNLRDYPSITEAEKVNMQLITRAIAANQNTFSAIVDNMFIYIDTDKVYTSDGVIDFFTFFEKFYRTSEYDVEFWVERLKTTSSFELLSPIKMRNFVDTSKLVIPNVTTQYINGKLATMVTSLSVRPIEAVLVNNSLYSSTSFLITDQEHRIVNQLGLALTEIERVAKPNSEKSRFMNVNGIPSLVIHITSEDFGWDYYSITPTASFSQESQRVWSLLIWICISLIIIGVIFSLIFSVNLYNPIKNIHQILARSEQGNGDIDIRSGDVFKIIDNQIHQLMRQNDDAVTKMNRYSNELLDQFFINVVNGKPAVHHEAFLQIVANIGFQSGQYICCGFMFGYKDRFIQEIGETDRLRIQEKMKNVLWGIMQQYVDCYVVELEHNFYICMINLKEDQQLSDLYRALDMMKVTFEYDTMYCELTIGMGKVYDKIGDLSKSYSDMMTAISNRETVSGIQIIDAINLMIEETYYYSFLDQRKIVNMLKAGNKQLVESEVKDLIQLNRNRNVSYSYLGILLVELMNTGIRYLNERSISKEQVLVDEVYVMMGDKNLSPNELDDRVALILNFYMSIIDLTETKTENRKNESVASLVTNYIENHYAEDIYLEKIALEINLSAKYVSRMFKESTGINITDYINDVRMTKAKELLINTDLKVTEIAEQVGIQSRTTFLRVFKKSEGFSPTDYRSFQRGSR